jgi:transposase
MEVSMSNKRYTEEFKVEAVKQVTERGHRVADVSARLDISQHSLYGWIKRYSQPKPVRDEQASQREELRRLRAELRRVTEERDILKKAAAYFAKQSG